MTTLSTDYSRWIYSHRVATPWGKQNGEMAAKGVQLCYHTKEHPVL